MEANLYKAMKAPEPPAESFIIATFESLPDISDSPETVEIQGRLTIASVERPVIMFVKSDRLPDGTRSARGSVSIRMTDFGITPPRPWGGILRTSDKVVVRFEIFIEPLPMQRGFFPDGIPAGDVANRR